MFTKWTDDMVWLYFNKHWDVTLHQLWVRHLSAISGRTKADIKRILLEHKKWFEGEEG